MSTEIINEVPIHNSSDIRYSSYTQAQKRATQKYRETNKDKMNEQRKKYYESRKEADPEFLAYKRQKAKEYYQRKKALQSSITPPSSPPPDPEDQSPEPSPPTPEPEVIVSVPDVVPDSPLVLVEPLVKVRKGRISRKKEPKPESPTIPDVIPSEPESQMPSTTDVVPKKPVGKKKFYPPPAIKPEMPVDLYAA